jgi:hypothetical protein
LAGHDATAVPSPSAAATLMRLNDLSRGPDNGQSRVREKEAGRARPCTKFGQSQGTCAGENSI